MAKKTNNKKKKTKKIIGMKKTFHKTGKKNVFVKTRKALKKVAAKLRKKREFKLSAFKKKPKKITLHATPVMSTSIIRVMPRIVAQDVSMIQNEEEKTAIVFAEDGPEEMVTDKGDTQVIDVFALPNDYAEKGVIEEAVIPVYHIEAQSQGQEETTPEFHNEFKLQNNQKKIQVIGDLTFVQTMRIFLSSLTKFLAIFYWPFKMHIIKKKHGKFFKENSSMVVSLNQPKGAHRRVRIFFVSASACLVLVIAAYASIWHQNIIDVKESVITQSNEAVISLRKGHDSINNFQLQEAAKNFERSKKYFEKASNNFSQLNAFTRMFIELMPREGENVKTAFILLDAGKNIADAGEKLSQASYNLLFAPTGDGDVFSSFLKKLSALEENLDFAIPKVAQAKIQINDIEEENIPTTNRDAFESVKEALPKLENNLSDLSLVTKALLHILGYEHWQRYLILFQNSNEMRPTGGFIGSFALMDIDRGKIKNLEIPGGGSYDLQGHLTKLIESPQPLHLINPVWEFQDSNWWPHFPSSAQKAAWFYEKARGPSVHGVIGVTSDLMEKILEAVGPLSMENYNRVITSSNFTEETQKIVEIEYDKTENKPKQFISDMAPELFQRISKLDQNGIIKLLEVLYQGFKEKHFMLYSFDTGVQKILLELDWGGAQAQLENGDYLSVIYSNIAGGKTDDVIKNTFEHTAQIQQNGSIINTLLITRTHTGNKGDLFTGVQNNSYIRIYVPQESELLFAEGFEGPQDTLFELTPKGYAKDEDLEKIESPHFVDPMTRTEVYKENNKTVFANWLMLKPGETKQVRIRYRLPFVLSSQNKVYTLTAQKQLGSEGAVLSSRIAFPDTWIIEDSYPKMGGALSPLIQMENSQMQYNAILDTDKFFGMVFSIK